MATAAEAALVASSDVKPEMEIFWQTPANPPEREDYIFLNGRRHVRPYFFEFICHVKNRWAGRTIVGLFSDEFKGRPYDYYVRAVKYGRIQVDGKIVDISYRVQSSQRISHFLHRHEPPVMSCDIQVLQKEHDVLTVCKPPTIPVHSCGQYRKNTIIGILEAESGLTPLFPVHRLDRLVSGLLIFARNSTKADQFRRQIESGMVQKQYIAKVVGCFPAEAQIVTANIYYDAQERRSLIEAGTLSGELHMRGKTACTKIVRISTNGSQSVVLCEPVTGRTHQIRVHLQYIGHPIANDPLYVSEIAGAWSTSGTGAGKTSRSAGNGPSDAEAKVGSLEHGFTVDAMCTNCPHLAPEGCADLEEPLWLHCMRYSGPGWEYCCPYPEWASL